MKINPSIDNKKVHFTDRYLIDPTHPITIALIGCGGTGSLILARLARLDRALRQLDHPGLQVSVFDFDRVEEHNIGRQNFTPADIDKNKASCLVEKVNMAFGLQWEGYDSRITVDNVPKANIIISAVDNAELRNILDVTFKIMSKGTYKKFREYIKPLYWLDTGNGKDFGQVILSTISTIQQPKKSQFGTKSNLPSIVDLYGDLSQYEDKAIQGMESCSFAESIKHQDLFINDAIALGGVTILWKLFTNLMLDYQGIIINQQTLTQKPIKI